MPILSVVGVDPKDASRGPPHEVVAARTPLRRALWMALGFLCVALGLVGVILPGLPTTPFLLLAAACFYRSSQRFYDWLVYNPRFGRYVRDFREGKGIPAGIKRVAILMMVPFVIYAVGWGIPADLVWVRGLTLVAGVVGVVYILSRPTNDGDE